MRRRVVVVDDDDISRRGLAELLAERPEIELLATLTHAEALACPERWDQVDIAVVDAADRRRQDDQFPGVSVVEEIRRRRSPAQTLVIVITGHFFDDALRRRMREAAADYFYHRSEVQDADALCEAVLHPQAGKAGVPALRDPSAMFGLGISRSSRVNAGVRYAIDQEFERVLAERSGRLGREWLRKRHEFNQRARLAPVTTYGGRPDRDQADPSVPQIIRFLRWATHVKDDPGQG